jgi:flagellar biosynthesis GTPase FlhF
MCSPDIAPTPIELAAERANEERLKELRRRFREQEKQKELAAKKARQMAKKAAKTKKAREQQAVQAAKTDQMKSHKRSIDEAEEEEEEVGTSSVSKEVAEIMAPLHAQDNRPKKRVLVAKDIAVFPAPAPSSIGKKSLSPSPTVRDRRRRVAARSWKSVVHFDLAVAGLLAAAWGVAYLAKAKYGQQ